MRDVKGGKTLSTDKTQITGRKSNEEFYDNELENVDKIVNFLENNVIKIDLSQYCLITNKLNQYFKM